MATQIKVPSLPESVADATVAKWYKKPGDAVAREENLVDLETDKVMLEVVAPEAGVVKEIKVAEGANVNTGDLLAVIEEGASATPVVAEKKSVADTSTPDDLSPAVRRLLQENNLDAANIRGTGKGGRITKTDVENALKADATKTAPPSASNQPAPKATGERVEARVPLSRLRQKVAERLVSIGQEAAMLTTFNEVNMQPVMELRKAYKDKFEKAHDTRLGFMSFFVKAVVEALKRFPVVNASIDGKDILYHNYFDIGIAIGSERGLVVPILRDADQLSFADVEKQIRAYAAAAKTGKISLDDMLGGTFTITNGGTYGSMMSTPIINPPQSAILGMHNIVERAVVENGQIVARPIMYLALSYDHRIIDGRESVQFLYMIKELLEAPARILLEV